MLDGYYTVREAADVLGIKYQTMIARVHAKKFTSIKRGWATFILKSEVDRVANAIANQGMEKATR